MYYPAKWYFQPLYFEHHFDQIKFQYKIKCEQNIKLLIAALSLVGSLAN